MLKLLTNFRL